MISLYFVYTVFTIWVLWGGLILFWPQAEKALLHRAVFWPWKLIGLWWWLLAAGVFLAAPLAHWPIFIYLIVAVMLVDALTFLLLSRPMMIFTLSTFQSLPKTAKKTYALILIFLAILLIVQFINFS